MVEVRVVPVAVALAYVKLGPHRLDLLGDFFVEDLARGKVNKF